MSWANIHVPRKRNISQIPEELRPVIVPRVNRPEVIRSEFYHTQYTRDTDTRDTDTRDTDTRDTYTRDTYTRDTYTRDKKTKEYVNPRQYVQKKIDSSLKVNAFELSKDGSYVFVILRNINTARDNDLWISCYNSIRKFYTNKIIIIDDNSLINTVDGKLLNTEIIKSEFNGAGEILPYYYFFKNKWADRMIFLHDSMFINRPFTDNELEGVKFHWHFNKEKPTRKISQFISLLNNKELEDYYNSDSKWKGCFGGTSIIDLDTVLYLEQKYNVFSTLNLYIKTRVDRESFERILGIILHSEGFLGDKCSNFGDIRRYPGAFESQNIDNTLYTLGQQSYDTAIIKVWRGR